MANVVFLTLLAQNIVFYEIPVIRLLGETKNLKAREKESKGRGKKNRG